MKSRKVKTKAVKKINRSKRVSGDISPIRHFFMDRLKVWCNEPDGRDERTARKQEIARHLKKNVQTIKNMYLYGQGQLDDWFLAMDFIGPLKQGQVVQLYNSYPYIEQKLSMLTTEQRRMHKNIARMSERELALVNKLVEVGLEANDSILSERE